MSYKTLIESVEIPNYSKKEEAFNTISHMLGMPLAVFIAAYGLLEFINRRLSVFHFIGLLIFAITAFLVYFVSYTYHNADSTSFKKKLFRIIDHSTIYLLIAGTYTPICFVLLETNNIGLIMLLSEWIGAMIGIILNLFLFQHKWARIISFILYVAMGWLCLYVGGFLYMPIMSFAFILAGGITYTIGSILYALGHKKTSFHCIFHVFVILGTIIQLVGVLLIV